MNVCSVDACVAGGCTVAECIADGAPAPDACACDAFGAHLGQLASFDALEFCVPLPSDDLELRISEALPGVRCMGSRGRIGCDLERERLCLWEPEGRDPSGLLSCTDWGRICSVSLFPGIERIQGTFFE
jgi:hypothetical protein